MTHVQYVDLPFSMESAMESAMAKSYRVVLALNVADELSYSVVLVWRAVSLSTGKRKINFD